MALAEGQDSQGALPQHRRDQHDGGAHQEAAGVLNIRQLISDIPPSPMKGSLVLQRLDSKFRHHTVTTVTRRRTSSLTHGPPERAAQLRRLNARDRTAHLSLDVADEEGGNRSTMIICKNILVNIKDTRHSSAFTRTTSTPTSIVLKSTSEALQVHSAGGAPKPALSP
eukprot:CAMPEP_0180179416 /NCGR_PEP_ID=MMETSP0986-20121125/39003_1 /TAXON_ID=697907 /ORGANISM="non described non described, Strain CCMP2293" /LENGTH=167 /DNA_ID=CAMNT_0022132481 /DNA_START=555 /DNA_END=1060 /DNA_ORIENTATION=+